MENICLNESNCLHVDPATPIAVDLRDLIALKVTFCNIYFFCEREKKYFVKNVFAFYLSVPHITWLISCATFAII